MVQDKAGKFWKSAFLKIFREIRVLCRISKLRAFKENTGVCFFIFLYVFYIMFYFLIYLLTNNKGKIAQI